MRFDDRLRTVLSDQPESGHDRAVRWRQLVELLARGQSDDGALMGEAYAAAEAEIVAVEERLRSATARAIARPSLPARLVAMFAADRAAVSAPVLAAADLSPEGWDLVFDRASADSRDLLAALRPEVRRSPVVADGGQARQFGRPGRSGDSEERSAPAESGPKTIAGQPVPSIAEVVARIERLRSDREHAPGEAPAERPRTDPVARQDDARGGEPGLFRWECGPSGEIYWVDGVPRGPLVGRSLADPPERSGFDPAAHRAFAARAPFRDSALAIAGEGAAAGQWRVSAIAVFEPLDGRFAGYRGVATRAAGDTQRPRTPLTALDDTALRELVHELKTPLNAIVGFAEIISGEYLGQADAAYRRRADIVVGRSRELLSAIEDLDLAARLRSDPAQAQGEADLRALLAQASVDLVEMAGRNGAKLAILLSAQPVECAVDAVLAERILTRFCESAIGAADQGERLTLSIEAEEERCCVTLERPGAARGSALDALREGKDDLVQSRVSLRLARSLARIAGGDIVEEGEKAMLVLPRRAGLQEEQGGR